MGSSLCNQQMCCSSEEPTKDRLRFAYGEDQQEPEVDHQGSIYSTNSAIMPQLTSCCEDLKQAKKLYKDPLSKTQPIILKSTSDKTPTLRCSYQRPYTFLKYNSSKDKTYQIFNKNSQSPLICVKDEYLQYFGVFLCFLADNPRLIEQLILTQPNSYGLHVVDMYVNGKHEHIFIDDYILCHNNCPLFTQPVNEVEMWPCLLEKAWLKVKGWSDRIKISTPLDVFQHFFSYPVKAFIIHENQTYENNNHLIRKIIFDKNRAKRFFFVTSRKEPCHKIGLSGCKSYYLITSFQFQGKLLFYLRNPCGNKDFRGSYRLCPFEISTKIKQLTNEPISSQNFILDESQFIEQMEELAVIYYLNQASEISEHQITINSNQQLFFSFRIESDSLVSLSFVQQPSYAPITYMIVNLELNSIIECTSNSESCLGIRQINLFEQIYKELHKGEYLVRLKRKVSIQNKEKYRRIEVNENYDKIVFTSSASIEIDSIRTESYSQLFINALSNFCAAQLKRVSINSKSLLQNIEHIVVWIGDLTVVYVEKRNSKKVLKLEIRFSQVENLQCINKKIGTQYTALDFVQDFLLIIFEKKDLACDTSSLGKFTLEPF